MPIPIKDINLSLNLPFFILIGLLLVCIPISPVIDVLALKPNYETPQFLMEFWRLLTGHLVHASWQHLAINLLNLILLRLVFREWLSAKEFSLFIIFSALVISIGLWVIDSLSSYVGFSGIFHALLLYLLLRYWKSSPWIFSLAIIFVIIKVIYEQLYGASSELANFIGVSVAIDSHALGIATAVVFSVIQKTLYK